MIEEAVLKEQPLLELAATKALANVTATPGMYYRSRVFNAKTGVNSLIVAAQPIIALISQLKRSAAPPQAAQLLDNLTHEFLTFEAHATEAKYDQQHIILARFLLCVALDEAMLVNSWQGESPFEYFYKEDKSKDDYFTIIEQLLLDAGSHLDLLELAYITLKLGFAKHYEHSQKGSLTLSEHQTQLYQAIRRYRGDKHIALFLKSSAASTPKKSRFTISIKKLSFAAIGIFAFIYCSYGYIIKVNYDLMPTPLKQSRTADWTQS